MSAGVADIFSTVRSEIDQHNETREKVWDVVKEADKLTRELLVVFNSVHADVASTSVEQTCKAAKEKLASLRGFFDQLMELVPRNEYFRYHDQYRHLIQRTVFSAAFYTFLKSNRLAVYDDVKDLVGLAELSPEAPSYGGHFALDIEDYLLGILMLTTELSRLAVTAVTNGDIEMPVKIRDYLVDLDAGFRLLNLKNDLVRKRFDALKYDLRRVEEVVFDLSVRGLAKAQEAGAGDVKGLEAGAPSAAPPAPVQEPEGKGGTKEAEKAE